MNPKVSIIIPAFNVENYIENTLDSLFKQTYKNLEIIVVDDKSTDNTLSVIENIIDPRLIIVKQRENCGVSAARNKGMSIASGKYVEFVDGDDSLKNDAVEKLVKTALNWQSQIVCFNLLVVSEKNGSLSSREKHYSLQDTSDKVVNNKEALKLLCLDKIKHTPPTYLFELQLWKKNKISFPVGRNYGEDYATIYKVIDAAKNVSILSDRLYFYVQRSKSVTHAPKISYALDNLKTTFEIDEYFADASVDQRKLAVRYTIPRLITALSICVNTTDKNRQKVESIIHNELLDRTHEVSQLKNTFELNIRVKLILNEFSLLGIVFKLKNKKSFFGK